MQGSSDVLSMWYSLWLSPWFGVQLMCCQAGHGMYTSSAWHCHRSFNHEEISKAMLVHLLQHHCSGHLSFTISFSLREMRRKEALLGLVIKAWCVEFRLLWSTQSPAAGNHGQPIWALNERNGWPVPAPLKTHLHPVRFHYAAGRWEWTESGRNAGLCSTRPFKPTASLHQTFFSPPAHSCSTPSLFPPSALLLLSSLPVGDDQEWPKSHFNTFKYLSSANSISAGLEVLNAEPRTNYVRNFA